MNHRLAVSALRQKYNEGDILAGVNLALAPGETVAIVGRSGCGKSTLLRSICLLESTCGGVAELDGQVYLQDGKVIVPPEKHRADCVMVFQDFNLFPNMTVLRNLTLALEHVRGICKSEARERATSLAQRLGIADILQKFPNELSGGQAQRVALCRALVLHPKVVCLDEITSALDAETILDVVDAIRHIRGFDENRRMSILMVTHLLRFAVEFADRIAFMHNGQVWEDLPAKYFLTDCKKAETKHFVANFSLPL